MQGGPSLFGTIPDGEVDVIEEHHQGSEEHAGEERHRETGKECPEVEHGERG